MARLLQEQFNEEKMTEQMMMVRVDNELKIITKVVHVYAHMYITMYVCDPNALAFHFAE